MDDAWLNTFAPSSLQKEEKPATRRRGASLLQQPSVSPKPVMRRVPQLIAEQDTVGIKPVIEPTIATIVEDDISIGPPPATILRRAQSYGDVLQSLATHEDHNSLSRQRSLGSSAVKNDTIGEVLDYGLEQFDLEDELLEASHEDYE